MPDIAGLRSILPDIDQYQAASALSRPPFFDGAIVRTGSDIQTFAATRALITAKYGVNAYVNPIAPGKAGASGENGAYRRRLNQDGRDQCAPGERYPKLFAFPGSL